ncbi:MAG TPA: hypothetical protein VLE74_01405 [Candidatus Saccharimonadales bacterium]|nr:hypothetical protein [Candidatus Saccharimonadales bacterium]
MAIWPFNRNKDQSAEVPQEVQDYYQSENRERSWVAWLLATGTLLVTVVVVLGLFYGGRWGYRKLKHQPAKTPTVAVQKPATASQPQTPPASPSTPQAAPSAIPGPNVTPQTSSTSTSKTASTPATTATVQPANSNLPNTGPGNIVAIFAVTALIGAVFHNRFLRQHS